MTDGHWYNKLLYFSDPPSTTKNPKHSDIAENIQVLLEETDNPTVNA